MQFFKKLGSATGNEGQKPSLLKGMKIKGPSAKEDKHKQLYAQSQTTLSTNEDVRFKKEELNEATRDDIGESKQPQIKTKKSKISEVPVSPTHIQEPTFPEQALKTVKSTSSTKEEHSQDGPKRNETIRPKKEELKKEEVIKEQLKKEEPKKKYLKELKVNAPSTLPPPQKKSEREQIVEELNESHLKILGLVQSQHDTKQLIAQHSAAIAAARESLAAASTRQTECVGNEEYEEAERLQERIEQIQRTIQEKESELGSKQEQYYKQEYEEIATLKQQFGGHKRILRRIKLVQTQLQGDAKNIKTEAQERAGSDQVKLDGQRKKMQRMESDIKFQTEQITSYEQTYTEDLNSKRGPLLTERKNLEKIKTDLEVQIQELERKLKEKKAEQAENVKKIRHLTESIREVDATFEEEGAKIIERKKKLQTLEGEKNTMAATIKGMEDEMHAATRTLQEQAERKMREAEELGAIGRKIEQRNVDIEEGLQQRRVKLDTFIHNGRELAQFLLKHRSTQEAVKELEYKKDHISGEIVKLQERRNEWRKRIPLLEIQQKAMASSKNFKAASLKKAEIKEANETIEATKIRIQEYLVEDQKYTVELEKLQSGYEEYSAEEQQLQHDLAVSQFKFEEHKLHSLQDYLEAIKISTVANKNYLALFLSSQIAALKDSLKYLQKQYDLGSAEENSDHEEPVCPQTDITPDVEATGEKDESNQKDEDAPQHYEQLVEEPAEESGYVPLQLD